MFHVFLCVPICIKSPVIYPFLKKPSLDCDVLKNFRPVSNLAFISKIIEKVASRLVKHMNENLLLDPMQSAYRERHSTETALLRVHSDIMLAINRGPGAVSFWCS